MDVAEVETGFVELAYNGGETCRIAHLVRKARGDGARRPGIVWLGGLKSDMRGTKASFLDEWARREGRAFLRFDYSGHGESGGRFEDSTVGDWLEQAAAMVEAFTEGPQILVGASLGGWIALLLARRLAERRTPLGGLALIAPAVDFTEELLWNAAGDHVRRAIIEEGLWLQPSRYSPEPTPITRRLIEEGRRHLLLGDVIRVHAPAHILQGMRDEDVPWRHATRIVERLVADPVTLSLVPDGDHRLSRAQDLAQLVAAIEALG